MTYKKARAVLIGIIIGLVGYTAAIVATCYFLFR